jgi:hypothetical protein
MDCPVAFGLVPTTAGGPRGCSAHARLNAPFVYAAEVRLGATAQVGANYAQAHNPSLTRVSEARERRLSTHPEFEPAMRAVIALVAEHVGDAYKLPIAAELGDVASELGTAER